MHYQLLQDLAIMHTAELRQAAAESRRAPVVSRLSWRQRTGWTLVSVGLALAAGSAAHPRPDTG
jgi:hypothetical protein